MSILIGVVEADFVYIKSQTGITCYIENIKECIFGYYHHKC